MKRKITLAGFIILMMTATALIAAETRQDKGQKKEEKQKEYKQDKKDKDQDKNDKGQGQGKNDDKDKGKNDNDDKGQGRNDDQDKKDKDEKDKDDKDKKDRGNIDLTDGFKWDRSSFKDRDKIKNSEKVTVCHKFNRENEPAVTIRVSSHALKAHLNHGDVRGECPSTDNSKWSNSFLKKRTDYYNDLQAANEQVIYSQSVLDYAKMRLAEAQQQLATTQASQLPMVQIQQRQAVVTELEQNVSLLETLVGVATQLVVNKLSN